MAHVISDRIKESSVSAGTGSVALAGAFVGFLSFGDALSNNDTTYYVIDNGAEWELGLGTWQTGGTLVREAAGVLAGSSGAGALVNFSAGTKTVFCTIPSVYLNRMAKWPMVSNLIDAGEVVDVPADRQLIVGGQLTNNGSLSNSGEVYIL